MKARRPAGLFVLVAQIDRSRGILGCGGGRVGRRNQDHETRVSFELGSMGSRARGGRLLQCGQHSGCCRWSGKARVRQDLCLVVFRAVSISWAARTYPAHDIAAYDASKAAYDAAEAADAAYDAAKASYDAAAAASYDAAAAAASYAAADAASYAAAAAD